MIFGLLLRELVFSWQLQVAYLKAHLLFLGLGGVLFPVPGVQSLVFLSPELSLQQYSLLTSLVLVVACLIAVKLHGVHVLLLLQALLEFDI